MRPIRSPCSRQPFNYDWTQIFSQIPLSKSTSTSFTAKMPARTTQNPSALIGNVPVLDGNSVGFPAWHTRLEELFAIQGVHDIVTGKLIQPETDSKDKESKSVTQGSH
jgi:hypothetical protein